MPTNVIMPQMGESVFEGTITKWLKNEGEFVRRDEPLFEISTDKVDTEIPSPVGGILQKIICPVGAKVPIHTVVAILDDAAVAPAGTPAPKSGEAPPPPVPAPAPVPAAADPRRIFSSPLVRRIAQQEGVDLSQIQGTGWKGRVTKKDIDEFMAKKGGEAAAPAAPAPDAAPDPVPAAPLPPAPRPALPAGRVQAVPMSPMRARIAEHMMMSRRTSAHVATVFEVDMSRIVELREREKRDFEVVTGTRLTFTPFYAAACVQALREFPIMNASVDGTNILYRRDINLAVAVAVPDGLLVPVIRNAEEKSFLGLCRAINDMAERARAKKIAVEEVQGGTFTITNHGIYGSLFGTPIINQPQVAILGIGAIEKRPVVIDDAIAIRSMSYLCLSFDHRVIDGAIADPFMARLKEILQEWTIPIR
jgi:2-oxoglutarate dehydrogenase E2 component (dihydrolipoamide succinyltransferase)